MVDADVAGEPADEVCVASTNEVAYFDLAGNVVSEMVTGHVCAGVGPDGEPLLCDFGRCVLSTDRPSIDTSTVPTTVRVNVAPTGPGILIPALYAGTVCPGSPGKGAR